VRQTEALATAKASSEAKPRETAQDPETAALERDLSERLGLTVLVSFDGKAGSITIKYRNLDQLDNIVARLNSG
jgi:ParB family chromosome partitioning protein